MTYQMCMPQRKVSLSFPAQLIHKSQTIVKNYKFVSQRAPDGACYQDDASTGRESSAIQRKSRRIILTCKRYWIQLLSTELVGWIIPCKCLFLFSVLFFESTFFAFIDSASKQLRLDFTCQ